MSSILPDLSPVQWTIADVQSRLPGFPADRIRTYPSPGTATEEDLLRAQQQTGRICELIDGTLVEKTMASYESRLAAALIHFLYLFLGRHNLGTVFAPDGFLRILPGQVRAPDVSFIRWERLPEDPGGKIAIYPVSPNLAVEILSEGNSEEEMDRKLRDYFASGVELVWYIDPRTHTAQVYTAVDSCTEIAAEGKLEGGSVLPGFELLLAELFVRVERPRGGEGGRD